ncbi:putative rRNA maturation factor [Varunaivibrio sulfuroxidans]|uniref:Endoribonuclease YbeY n=2 Tax=Varunaivibrio sulfuroxidans TaxID=1773489 RepID=A0A4R3JJJ6_9PROT|nr:putative rRNA maturation factor [Varunaivibrio sulfuroxidans]
MKSLKRSGLGADVTVPTDNVYLTSPPASHVEDGAAELEVDVVVRAGDWEREPADWSALADAALSAAFSIALKDKAAVAIEGDGAGWGDAPPRQGEVCVVLNDDDGVRALNRQWRAKDRPTNVLSFPAMGDAVPSDAMPWLLGDIVLALETVVREAREQGKTVEAHFSHLLVHGMLHLLGFDHETPRQAARMEPLEVAILATLGIADPYPQCDEG